MNAKRMKRLMIKRDIEATCRGLIEQKIDRYLEIGHQDIIGAHYFAEASSECIYLYRDGYFIGVVMMSHAINEGIIKFVADVNGIEREKTDGKTKTIAQLIDELQSTSCISSNCAHASKKIWESYRNDVHHMNPNVAEVPFQSLALLNIRQLATIEKEIFGYHLGNGAMIPDQPKYWTTNADGTVNAYLRLS